MGSLTSAAVCVLLAVASVAEAGGSGRVVSAGPDKVPNEYIVVLEDDIPASQVAEIAETVARSQNVNLRKVWMDAIKGFYVEMTEAKANALSHHPRVKYVEENATWSLSTTHATNVNAAQCNPLTETCTQIVDNRLWHLDRIDQQYPDPTNEYRYCKTGQGVTVYVLDTGVNAAHQEFAPAQGQPSRVLLGYNSTVEETYNEDGHDGPDPDTDGDGMPANDPCFGFALPKIYPEEQRDLELVGAGHGTAVAALVGGNRTGVAKDATIVPIKTTRCDQYSARYPVPGQYYRVHETVVFKLDGITRYYRATTQGTTAPEDSSPPWNQWPIYPSTDTIIDGDIVWKPIDPGTPAQTTQMIIDGLNWILSANNPGPKSNAVVTLSTWRVATEAQVAGYTPPGQTPSTLEGAVRRLLENNLTVIASANNQNGNACHTSPARMSIENTTNTVITVGGTMLINRPWSVNISDVSDPDAAEADGNGRGLEPGFNRTLPVREGRWICGAGDSSACSNNTPTASPNPSNVNAYKFYQGGSNAGECVTLFAPAKNLLAASVGGSNDYRDPRLRNKQSTGTSWSAPIVAGVVALILEANNTLTPAQIRTELINASVPSLDVNTLNTYDQNGVLITGTPNRSLRVPATPGNVRIDANPGSTPAALSGTTPLTLNATGLTLQYQWYEVTDANFDFTRPPDGTPRNGAHWESNPAYPERNASHPISGANSSTFNAPAATSPKAYWVRVTGICGSADSNIAVVVPRPAAPSSVNASSSGSHVSLTWAASSGATQYRIQRRSAGLPWATIATTGNFLSYSDTAPPAGMPVYTVTSVAGQNYLHPDNLATSVASNPDFANMNESSYESIVVGTTQIRAQHLIELRQATNQLADSIGATPPYSSGDLQLSSLQGTAATASHFTSLMDAINTLRTHAMLAMTQATFSQQPTTGLGIAKTHVEDLRNALK